MELSQSNNDSLDLNSSRLIDKIKINKLEATVERLQEELATIQGERLQLQMKVLKYLEMSVELREQNAILTELSITDPLTELLSRRGMLSRFHGQIDSRVPEFGSPKVATALFIDVDNFKRVNDTLGHDGGDTALVGLARIMIDSFRTEDILCRLGGDEFLVILPRATIEQSRRKAEEFQYLLASDARMSLGDNKSITVSIGIAYIDLNLFEAEVALENAMKWADRALYAAKEKGRNTIVVLGNESGEEIK